MRFKTIRNLARVAILGLAVSIPGTLFAQDTDGPTPRPAKLIDIVAQNLITQVTLPAIVQPSVTSDLAMLVGGTLQSLPIHEGQLVEKGDLLAQIDTITLQNDLAQAQAQYESANIEFSRAETLIKSQTIAQTVYDQRKAQRDLAKLTVEAAQTQLNNATLVAPFDGVIAVLNVRQFQIVSTQEPILTLQSRSDFEAVANVPAQVIANSTNFTVEKTSIILDVAPLQSIPVTYKSISPQADPASQTYEMRFMFQAPDGIIILSGMTGELHSTVRLTGPDADKLAIQIPLSAVLNDGTNNYVWVVDTDKMTVSKRQITLAPTIGEMLPVTDGLSVGETIVGAGASYLNEGMTIRRYEQ